MLSIVREEPMIVPEHPESQDWVQHLQQLPPEAFEDDWFVRSSFERILCDGVFEEFVKLLI